MSRNLDSLKKEAKRWFHELRADDPAARARLERALPGAPSPPTLRDVQHALAREHGYPGWPALKAAVERRFEVARDAGATALALYETMAGALLESLILMYCRDTTDAATEHLTGLRDLSYYFNSESWALAHPGA